MEQTEQKYKPVNEVEIFKLHSATAELHDRVCAHQGAFHDLFETIKRKIGQKKAVCITIPVSRYNFFCVGEIVTFAFSIVEEPVAPLEPFALFPIQTLCARYERYIAEIQKDIRFQTKVALALGDDLLLPLLRELQESVRAQPEREYQVIRLLSLLCEKTFIGPEKVFMELPVVTDDPMNSQTDELYRVIEELDSLHTKEIVLCLRRDNPLFDSFLSKIKTYVQERKLAIQVRTAGDEADEKVSVDTAGDTRSTEACFAGYFVTAITEEKNVVFCSPNRKISSLNNASFRDIWFSLEYERLRKQAKYLHYNKDVVFPEKEPLYGTDCTRSRNCQKTPQVMHELDALGWRQYLDL
jgi:hypothetical protein